MRISDWSSDVCSSDLDLVLVVGSPNSSNSNRLRELAEREGVEAYLVDGADEIDPQWLEGRRHIGVTAGASAPDILVQGVIERLHALGAGAGVDRRSTRLNYSHSCAHRMPYSD